MTHTFNPDKTITTIKRFLTGSLLDSGLNGYVVGLSGGIDSALACVLAVEAVGVDKVLAVLMPHRTSSESSRRDAMALVNQFGLEFRIVDISPMVDAYFPDFASAPKIRAGNKMARERMAVLFDIAHETGRLVLGTGNRTEICLGYTTLFGDSACSLNPIGELYKTEVRLLARQLGVPEAILVKAPTADLWAGQTDEGEIGVSYEQIDRILMLLVDQGVTSLAALEREGISQAEASRVLSMMNRNAFKRVPPAIAPLGKPPIPTHLQFDA